MTIVYNVDLRNGAGFFLSSKLQMRDKDVLFAANAESVNTAKFLQFVGLIIATASDGIVTSNNVRILPTGTGTASAVD